MKIGYIIFIITMILSAGCNNEPEKTSDEVNNVWNGDSQRIVIERFNGWTPNPDLRYTIFDYSRDMLREDELFFLSEIVTTKTDDVCAADGKGYDVVITDSSGIDKEYYSNNTHCNYTALDKAIDINILDDFVVLLER